MGGAGVSNDWCITHLFLLEFFFNVVSHGFRSYMPVNQKYLEIIFNSLIALHFS